MDSDDVKKPASIFGSKIQTFARSCKPEPSNSEEDDEQDFDSGEDEEKCVNKKRDCCVRGKCGEKDTRPPYARTMPENRRYGVVISNDDCTADSVDSKALMAHFFKLMESRTVDDLHFSDCTSMAKFCKNLLIVCEDDETANWVIQAVEGVCPPHTAVPFIVFFDLAKCSFVLPMIVPGKSLCSVFELLEIQNCGLSTDKWSVIERSILDPCEPGYDQKAVSALCENELIVLYIDDDSREIIENNCFKLKYCFWSLKFEFEC
ncbi:uncharacterized protein LOC108087157 [Drosophila ficusphila]|uniref:uncharacterized protein LOC108087157 n=1 Tax=Drosophila ficusphila TaxID=30025 RepID=UPI0007E83F00|nr:uncharacterized protein LOC108087157 [Drosophila ficusphila]